MAYDEKLAINLRAILSAKQGIQEMKMFGGLCFLLKGHMLCGVEKERFMFRVGKEREAKALKRPGASIMDFTGRRMGGLIWVDSKKCSKSALKEWGALAIEFVGSLPPKKKQ
ncbi:MAG: TfoX/Sxy family protein [Nitrospirota bacterium]|nr:TfoX/Sxy family protein [Nitrospirota bacterium]